MPIKDFQSAEPIERKGKRKRERKIKEKKRRF